MTEENLPSIFRRTAVCRYKATFVDAARIHGQEDRAAEKGIFARDPTLKDALRDNPACVVTLRSVCNFARRYTAADCRDMLERYVHGGDEGLTSIAVRSSCGLAVSEASLVDPIEVVLAAAEPPQPVDEVERVQKARRSEQDRTMEEIQGWLVQDRKDFFTAAQVKNCRTRTFLTFDRKNAQDILDKLEGDGRLLSLSTVLQKAGQTTIYLPRISAQKALGEVIPLGPDENMCFTEEFSMTQMRQRLAPEASRMLNLKTLAKSYKQRKAGDSKKKGIKRKQVNEHDSDVKLGEELAIMQDKDADFFEEIKTLAEAGEQSADGVVAVQREYFYSRKERSRRFVKQRGAQSCSRLARAVCCPSTRDLDLHASMFNIVVQLVDALVVPDLDLPAWRAVAADRKKVCEDKLHCSEAEGKQLLLETANGASMDKNSRLSADGQKFLQELSDESRALRWLACTQLPDLYTEIRGQKKSGWPEATVFSYWWTAAEDYILQHILHGIRMHYLPGHISCHFDGVLVAKSLVLAVEEKVERDMIEYLQEHVSRATPFRITLKDKTLPAFEEKLRSAFEHLSDIACFGVSTDLLSTSPNSIPPALVFIGADLQRVVSSLEEESPANAVAETRNVRRYADWHGLDTKYLLPAGKLEAPRQKNCLLHMELPDQSCCLGVRALVGEAIRVSCKGKSFETTWQRLTAVIESFVGTKETMLFEIVEKDPELDHADTGFLDLLAGASVASSSRKRPAAAMDGEPGEGSRNEGEVNVGEELRRLLQEEVNEALRAVDSQSNTTFLSSVCPCCPWRRFEKRANLRRHLISQHKEAKRYCPSGTKQLRIAIALYDHDAIAGGAMSAGFLRRSAAIMRADVKPPVPTTNVHIDKTVRYVLDANGPRIMALHCIKSSKDLRRVGNFYYTYDFACAFLQAAAAGNGSLQKIYSAFLGACTRHDGQLSSIIPRATNGFWTNVLEDLMQAPPFHEFRQRLLEDCRAHDEFRYLSVDATFKINLKVIGQADFHASQSSRATAAIPEASAGYRTLTCRGRTGAAVLIRVVRSEKATVVAETPSSTLPADHRAQVVHVASDAPSAEMFRVLKGVLPNLCSISLDAMHIVMVYQQNMNNKKTQGSRWLALLMDKFRKRHPVRTAASWGPFYTGQVLPSSSADVRAMRERLEAPDMSAREAYEHLETVDPDQPWLTEIGFLEAVHAHLSLFYDEVQKITYSGVSLHRLILNMASQTKVQWLLNDTRYRHSVERESLVLLPSGTTSNESLHHEINHWFRETATWLHLS